MWDLFISHASEDKVNFVDALVEELERSGLRVWYDRSALTLGDSLRRKIDEGLASSRFGVVVLSKHFFEKNWPQRELDGLAAREDGGGKVILPIWHGVVRQDVALYSPTLADRLAISSEKGINAVVLEILTALGSESPSAVTPTISKPREQFQPQGCIPLTLEGFWQACVTYQSAPMTFPRDVPANEVFEFEIDGDQVHGAASFLGLMRGLFDGKLNGSRLSFITKGRDSGNRQVEVSYRGTHSGDEIAFVLVVNADTWAPAPIRFVATRGAINQKLAE